MNKHYKHPQYGIVFCSEELNTPVGRGCWFSLVSPKDPPPPKPGEQPGKPRFEATILLEKDSPKVTLFLQEVAGLLGEMQDLYNEGEPAKLSIESFVKDGDTFDMEKYPYYKNQWVLVARNSSQPETYDVNAETIEPNAFIGGQKIRMRIQPLVTAKGASFKLKVIQLLADDGVRFAGGTRDYKSLMSVLDDDAPQGATVELKREENAVQVELPLAPTVKPVAPGTPVSPRGRGRPPVVKTAAAPVKPIVQAAVNPANLRAQAAAKVSAAPKVSAPVGQPKKGMALAIDKI